VNRIDKLHCAPSSTLLLIRDGRISWPDEVGKQGAEGVSNTEAGKVTVVGLAMQLWQA
jgi:hypothetical protein